MKLAGLILFLFISFHVTAQDHVLKKRNRIEKKLNNLFVKEGRSYSKEDLPGLLVYVINDSLSLPFSLLFYFDKTDRCIAEERIFNCDSCMKKDLAATLSRGYPKWHSTENGNYKSNFPSNTYLETEASNKLFIIRFTYMGWKGGKYENFIGSFNKQNR